MTVNIKKATKEQIAEALKKMEAKRKYGKGFDAYKYCGILKLKEDPLKLQKKWRNEWK